MQAVNIPVAFIAGTLSFFAPCVLPLLPVYISYIAGVSVNDLKSTGIAPFRKKVMISSVVYVLGFSLVFILIGSAIGGIGAMFRGNARQLQVIGGILLVFFGLQFSGILKVEALAQEYKIKVPDWAKHLGYLRAFLLGILFSLAWSPCIGPILGVILALAAVEGTALEGALLLFVYSLGISLPFLVVSATLGSAPKYLKSIGQHIKLVNVVSSILLILLGVLLITGTYAYLSSWLAKLGTGLAGI